MFNVGIGKSSIAWHSWMDLKPQNATATELRNNFYRLKPKKKSQKSPEKKSTCHVSNIKGKIEIYFIRNPGS